MPNLNIETFGYYKSAYEIDQALLVNASGKTLNGIYMSAWKLGLKSTYYLRSQSPDSNIDEETMDRGIECEGCQ